MEVFLQYSPIYPYLRKEDILLDNELLTVLRYAKERSEETLDRYERGLINEKQASIRTFLLGKSLIGWPNDDDRSDLEIVNMLLQYNQLVMDSVDETAGRMAS
jgi:hypothetical protein